MGASDRYAYSLLNQGYRSWLAALPTSANAEHDILACHGTPTSDNRYLVEEVSDGPLVRASLAAIKERLGAVQARVVLCGHSHQGHFIQLPDGPVALNPGSVGCPSYDDPGNGSARLRRWLPHARYAVRASGTPLLLSILSLVVSLVIGNRRLRGLKATADPTGRMACATRYRRRHVASDEICPPGVPYHGSGLSVGPPEGRSIKIAGRWLRSVDCYRIAPAMRARLSAQATERSSEVLQMFVAQLHSRNLGLSYDCRQATLEEWLWCANR
jgi:hypothetical protein